MVPWGRLEGGGTSHTFSPRASGPPLSPSSPLLLPPPSSLVLCSALVSSLPDLSDIKQTSWPPAAYAGLTELRLPPPSSPLSLLIPVERPFAQPGLARSGPARRGSAQRLSDWLIFHTASEEGVKKPCFSPSCSRLVARRRLSGNKLAGRTKEEGCSQEGIPNYRARRGEKETGGKDAGRGAVCCSYYRK